MSRLRKEKYVIDGNHIKCPYCRTIFYAAAWEEYELNAYMNINN